MPKRRLTQEEEDVKMLRAARKHAKAIARHHMSIRQLWLEVAVLFGPRPEAPSRSLGQWPEMVLYEVCADPSLPGIWDSKKLGFEVEGYPDSGLVFVPGILTVRLGLWSDFRNAVQGELCELKQVRWGRREIVYAMDYAVITNVDVLVNRDRRPFLAPLNKRGTKS
jgi:hypothetical protein